MFSKSLVIPHFAYVHDFEVRLSSCYLHGASYQALPGCILPLFRFFPYVLKSRCSVVTNAEQSVCGWEISPGTIFRTCCFRIRNCTLLCDRFALSDFAQAVKSVILVQNAKPSFM